MRGNVLAKFAIVIFFATLMLSIASEVFLLKSHNLPNSADKIVNYHLMKTKYDTKGIHTLGSYFGYVEEISSSNTNIARNPGGHFLNEYSLFFMLSGGSYFRARILYTIVVLISALMFLLWVYARFGIITTSIVSALMLTNGSFLFASNSFYAPHSTLMLSFFFLPLFAEYTRDRYESLIPSVLICPILALMCQAHFAVFFNMVATFIIYLVINWDKKTKYNIRGFAIGTALAASTYFPYLIGEIRSGFANTKMIMDAKRAIAESSQSIIEPTRIHNILFFPTDETGIVYGSIDNFLSYWIFNDSIVTRIIFIFYIFSMLLMLVSILVSLKDYIVHRNLMLKPISNKEKNKSMLQEMFVFFMLYFVVTIISYNIFGIGIGRAHHFYNAYTLSFVPIIYFVESLKSYRSRLLKYVMIFVFINMFALTTKTYIQNKSFEPYGNFYLIGEALRTIVIDSNGQRFVLDSNSSVNEVGKAYFGVDNWNSTRNRDVTLRYIFRNANANNSISTNVTLIFESPYHKIYKENR